MRTQLRTVLRPAAEEVIKLPRSTYKWNPELEVWEAEPTEAGDLKITFSYPDPETLETHVVQINMLWTHHAPTVVVAAGENRVEVPQGARLLVQDNDTDLLDLDITASWRTLPGCGRVLEPESLILTGFMEHPRPLETGETAPAQEEGEAPNSTLEETDLLLELSLEEAVVRGGETLTTSFEMSSLTEEGFEAKVGWVVAAILELEHEDCVLSGGTLEELDLYTEAMIGPEAGPYKGSNLSLELFELVYNDDGLPVGTDLDAELTSFDKESGEEDLTTVLATVALDEEEGLIAEGEVTLPEGQVVDVMDYIDALIEAYLALAEDAAERGAL